MKIRRVTYNGRKKDSRCHYCCLFNSFNVCSSRNSQQHANGANVESNSTSTTCIDDKPCVTTICINNEPCRTITSNSTTTGNLTDNNNNPVTSPFVQAPI